MLDHLPHPIFLEILFRIPVCFLVKCMSVSKTWYSLIKSAEFIYSHLESSISGNTKNPHIVRLLYHDEDRGFSVLFESFESHENFHKQLIIPRVLTPNCYYQQFVEFIGYSNGIFCYALSKYTKYGRVRGSGHHRYLLWNPSLKKYVILPPSNYKYHIFAAFVFDSNVNDFKVFAVLNSFEVELYSLKYRSWKIISVSHDIDISYPDWYFFVKGVIYFRVFKYILGFNLADEDFHKIMVPESLESLGNYDFIYPILYENTSIAVVAYYYFEERMELWFMEEMSVSGTWKKVLLDMNCITDCVDSAVVDTFFGVWKGKLLFESIGCRVTSLDLNCQQNEDVGLFERVSFGMFDYEHFEPYNSFHRYEETLALLDNGKDISSLEQDVDILVNSRRQ